MNRRIALKCCARPPIVFKIWHTLVEVKEVYDNLYHVLCNRAAETSQCDLEAASEDGLASFWEPSPRYGTAYLYDADRLARRIGPEFARELESVQHLLGSMRCQLPSPTPSTP
jgi:hypothetical protein